MYNASQLTAVFLLGVSRGQKSLTGYSPQGCKESKMAEATQCAYNMGLPLITDLMEKAKEEKGMAEDEVVGWITNSMDVSFSKLQELSMDREV